MVRLRIDVRVASDGLDQTPPHLSMSKPLALLVISVVLAASFFAQYTIMLTAAGLPLKVLGIGALAAGALLCVGVITHALADDHAARRSTRRRSAARRI